MLIEMKVVGINIHPETNTPVVWLKEPGGDAVLPIWIGVLEATAIATELENIVFPRPMTHDLLRNVIKEMGGAVESIRINDLRSNTFYAIVHVRVNDAELLIDARPSDAIALALRTKVGIYVDDKVIRELDAAKASSNEGWSATGQEDEKKWREMLEKLSPNDFSKYKM